MASKISNQITFTEQKQIEELREWYLATTLEDGVTWETEGWTTTVQSINSKKKYLWNYEEVIYSIGPSEKSEPVLVGIYGTGDDGVGITDILNYYGVTQEPELPEEISDTFWKDNFTAIGMLSSKNKYLWNYEKILYTDGSSTVVEPTIIGVYGDSGEDAITFQIYSPDGFEFKDSIEDEEQLTSIELKLAAFKGSDPLTKATYTWSYWNSSLNDGTGGYEDIEGYINTTSASLIVNNTDSYALSNLRCTMLYNEKTYEDYVTLTTKVDVYNANINFFNNTNILTQTEEYIVGYVELYKNNKLEESIKTANCYMGNSTIDKDTGIITTDYSISDTDSDNLSYFVCLVDDNYKVVLGEYNGTEWVVVDNTVKYIYQIDIDSAVNSNIFLISKKHINRSKDVNIKVYMSYTTTINEDGNKITAINTDSLVAMARTTITDLNDVIIDSNEPVNIYEGQMWLDTTNGMLKIYIDGEWVSTSKQNRGQNTYTVKPDFYNKDDLWIVSKTDEIIGFQKENGDIINFIEGSIWIATQDSDENGFNAEHWSDAVPEITALQNNVNYYFDFNKETGLKIGHNNDRFYVNIKSTRMSFCENTDVAVSGEEIEEVLDPHEVVYIGNRSATIRNLIVEESANIHSVASIDKKVNIVNTYETKETHPGFSWQIEPDGGFSLVKMEVE